MTKFWISGENPAENEEFFIVKNFYNKNPKTAEERKLEKKVGKKHKKNTQISPKLKNAKKNSIAFPPHRISTDRAAQECKEGEQGEGA